MPINFDIETDYVYQRGVERGVERGIEQGSEQTRKNAIVKMLQDGKLTIDQIALYQSVTVSEVQQIKEALERDNAQ